MSAVQTLRWYHAFRLWGDALDYVRANYPHLHGLIEEAVRKSPEGTPLGEMERMAFVSVRVWNVGKHGNPPIALSAMSLTCDVKGGVYKGVAVLFVDNVSSVDQAVKTRGKVYSIGVIEKEGREYPLCFIGDGWVKEFPDEDTVRRWLITALEDFGWR